MERRVAQPLAFRLAAGARLAIDALATRRSTAAFLSPGPYFRMPTGGLFALPDPGGFRRPSSAPRPAIQGSPP